MEPLYAVLRILFVGLTLLGLAAAVRAPRDRAPGSAVGASAGAATTPETANLAWRGSTVTGRDPFRIVRKAPTRRYERLEAAAVASTPDLPPPPATPRPDWHLTGIVWGSAPVAVFEGVDGVEGSALLGEGDTVGAIRVERLTPDTVVLRGPTESWSFTVEAPWKKGGAS